LLEQIVTEAQGLKLPENRVRVQITAAEMLGIAARRARADCFPTRRLCSGRWRSTPTGRIGRGPDAESVAPGAGVDRARHDADLAYQMLRSTQSLTANNAGNGRRGPVDPQSNLEQNLLAAIAASDPKIAYQKANESLDKGEYPTALARVLAQLQTKDPEAFKKLSDRH